MSRSRAMSNRAGELEQSAVNQKQRRPRSSLSRGSISSSSRDSSQDAHSNCSSNSGLNDGPSKETISEALDKYMNASREGREAFSHGKLSEAVRDFDQALDIELQTELECLYDTSIGMVSGMVRSEVDSRLGKQGKFLGNSEGTDARCSKILQRLRDIYQDAASGVKGKKSDSPQWYLQMGATLVVIDEWEKAKAIYTDGISICKEKKELKVALKNLIKIEQMTSYGEIPAEDQPDRKPDALLTVTKSSPSHRGQRSSPVHSPRITKRDRAGSANVVLTKLKKNIVRERSGSLSLDATRPPNPMADVTLRHAQSPPITKRESKRMSLGIFNGKRTSSGFLFSRSRSPSLASPEEVELWSSCFQPHHCQVFTHREYQPSAITHMRRLTSIDGSPELETDEPDAQSTDRRLNSVFTAVNQSSMRIEDDDSDIDD